MAKIGPYEIVHHTETARPESFVVFWRRNGRVERATHLGKKGGFRTHQEAVEAVTKLVRYGTTHV
jgi:hypothetical protein